jgi:hypothetical protein
MPGDYPSQPYVPTKKTPIPSLPVTHLNRFELIDFPAAHVDSLEASPPLTLCAVGFNGRWLQIPTADRWELLPPTTSIRATAPDDSKQYTSR